MKIAVLFGGQSSERDVSISSASQVYKALKGLGHDVIAIDTAMGIVKKEDEDAFLSNTIKPLPPDINGLKMMKNGLLPLIQSGALEDRDVCFLALHGGNGENGMMQGFLDIMGIPYTGPNHTSSACCMDKDITKTLFVRSQVPTPKWLMMPVTAEKAVAELGLPLVVKPNKEGSTVGLTVVKDIKDFDTAVKFAYTYDTEVMLEQFIPGREFTVGVLDGQALAAGEIIPKMSEIFDYKSKYMPGGSEEIFPALISKELSDRMRRIALDAAKAAKIDSYCRVDFRLDADGNLYVLEINTLPGMTSASLLPKSAKAVGISFEKLCERICTLALRRK
ncbi:MAG: D-alanine--D-alanine ligase [Spirochaetia bacterium]|nr:D-alanine--D-alanine ligase [Spirochaetia bacterium]